MNTLTLSSDAHYWWRVLRSGMLLRFGNAAIPSFQTPSQLPLIVNPRQTLLCVFLGGNEWKRRQVETQEEEEGDETHEGRLHSE